MKVSQAIDGYVAYHRANSKKNTIRNHEYVLQRFREQFDERELGSITSDEILAFLTHIAGGKKQTTKRVRYSLLKAFFNFIRNNMDAGIQNPSIIRLYARYSRPQNCLPGPF